METMEVTVRIAPEGTSLRFNDNDVMVVYPDKIIWVCRDGEEYEINKVVKEKYLP